MTQSGLAKQCSHGYCQNHAPEWEDMGDNNLQLDLLNQGEVVRYKEHICCGEPMVRCKQIYTVRCRACTRLAKATRPLEVAFCNSCRRELTL